MNAIEVINLTKKFGSFTSVDNVSFNVAKGEIFGFLGANGAGKTTTIRMLCGLLAPTSGDAFVGGFSINSASDAVKKNIGYMSQKFSLYNDLTVDENIQFFGGVYGMSADEMKQRKSWIIKTADLEGKGKLLTGSLPGGIKQRLALSVAVIHKPAIVFLDEPTSGVDPLNRRRFWDLIDELSSEGITVFVTTHYLEEAEYCRNLAMMNAGKIVASGSPAQLKSNYLPYPIYEIQCKNPVELNAVLSRAPFAEESSLFGSAVHLLANNSKLTATDILNYTAEHFPEEEAPVIDRIQPGLEDVFIHLLKTPQEAK